MGVIDNKVRFEGAIKPRLWWRYRDNVFDIWTQGLEKLLEFTSNINFLYPTIKFELVYSESSLNVMDLTVHLREGYIVTDIYSKPADGHFSYTCRFRVHTQIIAKRLSRMVWLSELSAIVPMMPFLKSAAKSTKAIRNSKSIYSGNLVEKQFNKVMELERSDILKTKTKIKKKKRFHWY